jgi:hypothetical protein
VQVWLALSVSRVGGRFVSLALQDLKVHTANVGLIRRLPADSPGAGEWGYRRPGAAVVQCHVNS